MGFIGNCGPCGLSSLLTGLEKTGSFIWPLIDGERTIFEIGKIVGDHFGNDADPLYVRLSDYFRLLKNCGFVKLERGKAE